MALVEASDPHWGLGSLEGPLAFPVRKPQPDIGEVRGLAAPARSVALPDSVARSRSRRPRRRCRSPGTGLQQGAGKGTLARSGNRGKVAARSLAATLPPPPPGTAPAPAGPSLSTL